MDRVVEVGFWTTEYFGESNPPPAYAGYRTNALRLGESFGEWNGYFYTHDHNKNGREELIGFTLSGSFFALVVWEFHDGQFVETLGYIDRTPMALHVSVPGPGEFVLYNPSYPRTDPPTFDRLRYAWDVGTDRYVLKEIQSVSELPSDVVERH